MKFTSDHFNTVKKRSELIRISKEHNIPLEKTLKKIKYELELRKLQSEFVNLQKWISQNKMRVAVLFEGRASKTLCRNTKQPIKTLEDDPFRQKGSRFMGRLHPI